MAGAALSGSRWRRTRIEVLAESDVCWICGRLGSTTVDHVIPRSMGGAVYDKNNLRPAHSKCNSRRGAGHKTPKQPHSQEW